MPCRRRRRLLGPRISFACRLRHIGYNLARSARPGTRCKVYRVRGNLYLISRGVGAIASRLLWPLHYPNRGLLYSVEFRIVG